MQIKFVPFNFILIKNDALWLTKFGRSAKVWIS